MKPLYRADHVGSLLRPKELLDARNNPRITRDELTSIEDRHILAMLERQQAAGLKIFTDGEFRRAGFMSDFYDSVEGLDHGGEIARTWKGAPSTIGGTSGNSAARSGLAGVAVEKIVQNKRLTEHEVDFLKKHAPGDIKVTLPTANQFPAICYKKGLSEKAYPTHSAFLWDIVPIIKAEIQALVADGVKYIQIDAPRYSYYIDPKWRAAYPAGDGPRSRGGARRGDSRRQRLPRRRSSRPGVTLAIHLCRGNNRSQWYAERRLRSHRRKAVQPARRRPVPPRVRIRSRRHVRAAAVRAAEQGGCAGPRQQQAAGARVGRTS